MKSGWYVKIYSGRWHWFDNDSTDSVCGRLVMRYGFKYALLTKDVTLKPRPGQFCKHCKRMVGKK